MFASRIFQLLLLVLGITALAQALHMDAAAVNVEDEALVKRQRTDPTADADSTTTSSSPTSTPDDPTDTPTESPTDGPDSSTSTPPKTTNRPTTTSKEPEETSSSTSEPITETQTTIITTTNADGSVETMTSETTSTRVPGLSDENKSGGSGGMTTDTRNLVIGVVVGVGGAIVLGALAFVAWRVWGRKKGSDENDGLMNYNTGYSPMDKSEGGSSAGPPPARNPFQSTLETYHAPTQVNASSNF